MRVYRLRWAWLLGSLVPLLAVAVPVLFLLVDRALRLLGVGGADPVVFGAAVALGSAAVVANARRDKVVVDAEGLRLSEGEAPVDLLAPWSAVEGVRRTRVGPLTVDRLVLSGGRLLRREPTGTSALRGPLRERAFRRERDRRRGSRPQVNLTLYCRGGWDGPLGEVVRRHRPDLVVSDAGRGRPRGTG